jgi:hypothetical protein
VGEVTAESLISKLFEVISGLADAKTVMSRIQAAGALAGYLKALEERVSALLTQRDELVEALTNMVVLAGDAEPNHSEVMRIHRARALLARIAKEGAHG